MKSSNTCISFQSLEYGNFRYVHIPTITQIIRKNLTFSDHTYLKWSQFDHLLQNVEFSNSPMEGLATVLDTCFNNSQCLQVNTQIYIIAIDIHNNVCMELSCIDIKWTETED